MGNRLLDGAAAGRDPVERTVDPAIPSGVDSPSGAAQAPFHFPEEIRALNGRDEPRNRTAPCDQEPLGIRQKQMGVEDFYLFLPDEPCQPPDGSETQHR